MIRLGIVGYGNLGRATRFLIEKEKDLKLVKIFTRRNPETFNDDLFESLEKIKNYVEDIDILILTLGSAKDIPELAPRILKNFNTVDCYDNHAEIPHYFEKMNEIAKLNKKCAFISTGWDPGLFSLNRMVAEAILTEGNTYTFWGKGVSQGHSDAVRRIDGVKKAVQYTIPKEEILNNIKAQRGNLKSYETHIREVFVVAEEGADKKKIEEEIVNMKDYFADYEVTVNFIDEEEFEKNHTDMPHGGYVIRVGESLDGKVEMYKFSLELMSNPNFTSLVAIASARALFRFMEQKNYGAHTVLDTPPYYYTKESHLENIEKYL
ncbi:diaminopimelate D-dehydrogenase [Peptoniphilus sp. ING2-D1G]|nr:diaminopimelate D-dehydrogenase [Peptoniphilus sp. ING2-D1G]